MDLQVKTHSHTGPCVAKKPSAFCKVIKTKELLMRVSVMTIFISLSVLLMAGNSNSQDLH